MDNLNPWCVSGDSTYTLWLVDCCVISKVVISGEKLMKGVECIEKNHLKLGIILVG